MIKKIIFVFILLIIFVTFIFLLHNNKNNLNVSGKYISTEGSIIKIVKEYKDGNPVYVNEDINVYILDIKSNNEYILYANNSIVDSGKYNTNTDNEKIMYFNSSLNSNIFIWQCKIKDNTLYDCNNYATDFVIEN